MNRRELSDALSDTASGPLGALGHPGPESSDDAIARPRFTLRLPCSDAPGGEFDFASNHDVARELERVHARELGYLLREAARLRSSIDPAARRLRWLGGRPTPVAVWRRAFEDETDLLQRDRCETSIELAWVLERCRAPDIADWPSALELADSSLAVAPDEVGRLERVIALLARGDTHGAACAAATEVDHAVVPRRAAEFLAALALARERERRFADAARLYDEALDRSDRVDCRLWVAARLLYLALVVGERVRADRAAGILARITDDHDFDPRELDRCARDLGESTTRLRRGRRFGVHPTMERQFLRFTAASAPIVRRVAVALG